MRKLVEYIAQSLVDDPSAVQVREVRNDRNALVMELHVAPDDFGKVIGRQGRVARAMRTLLRAGGTREGRHTSLEIL
ncbi:MAG TPA: KH domain-containing protein [Ktedonobacteraceae bacterium]|nr:KH domain-containing protein [Ktedonobacteraceae bacterium]